MEQGFIDILKKVVTQHGKEYFKELKKCKAIVSDYTGSDYRNERGLLLRAVEAGVSNALLVAEKDDIDRCMKAMQRKLQEEEFMDTSIAWSVVIMLANVLRDVVVKEVKTDIKAGGTKFDEAMSLYHDEQYDKAIPIFEALAKENHAGAQFQLGACYLLGRGFPEDEVKASKWVLMAAEQGHAQAQWNLGTAYQMGMGVPEDITKAAEWFLKAAEQGYTHAQDSIGYAYENGCGVPKDYAKAAEWYRKAAEQGSEEAKDNLAYLKKEGKI
jgi:TPR repeat protein